MNTFAHLATHFDQSVGYLRPSRRLAAMVAAVLFASCTIAMADLDGDGIPDELDDCSNTPPGVLVDAAGRPFGDLDGDCDADLEDFQLFLRGFTGALPPWNVELCDDGLDNDDDALVDCADVDDCEVGIPCGQGLYCSQFAACGCPAGRGDCDGIPGNGCEESLNNNPVCNPPAFLGSVSGDSGSDHLQETTHGERWFRVTIREDNDADVYLSATVQLHSAEGTNYDLYLYCGGCGGYSGFSSTNTGPFDYVYPRWDDQWFGVDDTYDITVEVRWVSGTCGDYTLDVFGNTNLDSYPNTCNP